MSLLAKLMDKRLGAYQRELIEIHYAEVENMYRQIRGWRHDYRSHIQVMKALAAEEDWDALRGYLDELETDLSTVDTVVKTGNPMADAILNSKISLAQAQRIPVQADAHIPVALALSELDECVPAPSGVEEELDVRLLADCVERFVRTLPDTQRRVFLRRYWYLCSVKEVAAQSGMSVSRTSSMLFRLRKSLKQYLEKEGIMVYERAE